MEKTKLAIVIYGDSYAGKSTTWKNLLNEYDPDIKGKYKLSNKRSFPHSGKRKLRICTKLKKYICIEGMFLNSSCEETGEDIQDRVNGYFENELPHIILCSIQKKDGEETTAWLKKKDYKIVSFELSGKEGASNWDRWNRNTRTNKLGGRCDEIINALRNFVFA